MIRFVFILWLLPLFSCGKVEQRPSPELDIFAQQQVQSGGLMLVNTVDDSFASGSMALIPLSRTDAMVQDLHTTTNSDFYLRCRANVIYRIESFNQDRITLFDRYHPQNILSQVLTKPIQEPTSSVPIDLAFGPNDSALLLRYSRNRALWMNTSNFNFSLQDELDLSTLADSDGYSEPKSALYWDGLWYLTHQRLNRLSNGGWSDSNVSKLSIVSHQKPNLIKSLELKIRNPISKMIKLDGDLLIAGAGDLIRKNVKFAGVEVIGREINVIDGSITHQSKRVVLAGKQIIDMAKMNQNHFLAIEYIDANKTKLYLVNASTGLIEKLPGDLSGFEKIDDGHLSALERDPQGNIWLAVFTGQRRGLWKFTSEGSFIEHLQLRKKPLAINFCQ